MIRCAAAMAFAAASCSCSTTTQTHRPERLRSNSAESFSDIVELRLGPRHDITLVRPDGYIAYSAHNREGIAALTSVRSLLERQTN